MRARMQGSIRMVLAVLALACAHVGPAWCEAREPAGQAVPVADTSRVVAIGGAVTEILYALGLGARLVAVDQTSTFPAAARALPNVGYMRTLTPEGVLSAAPSVILAMDSAGPKSTLDVLKQASVPVVLVPEGHTPEAVIRKIEVVAEAMGVPDQGRRLAQEVQTDFETLAYAVRDLPQTRAVFVLSASSGAPVVGGSGTSADAMLHLAGAINAMASLSGFKPAVDEAALAADPDAIVVMRDGAQMLTSDALFSLPAFQGTPAARDRRLIALPGSYLLGFGPRTPQAVRDLALALHPGAVLPALPVHAWSGELKP